MSAPNTAAGVLGENDLVYLNSNYFTRISNFGLELAAFQGGYYVHYGYSGPYAGICIGGKNTGSSPVSITVNAIINLTTQAVAFTAYDLTTMGPDNNTSSDTIAVDLIQNSTVLATVDVLPGNNTGSNFISVSITKDVDVEMRVSNGSVFSSNAFFVMRLIDR